MKKIKTLIVDDEPLARERLAALLLERGGHRGGRPVPRRRRGRDGHPGSLAAPGVPRRADAADERLRSDRGGRQRAHAARHLRDRLRSARAEGLPGPRARLHPQAVRSRALLRRAAARAPADRARGDRRPRPPPAGARQGPAQGSAAHGPARRQVRRPPVLPADGRDRLDRSGRQLRPAARRERPRTCCARR